MIAKESCQSFSQSNIVIRYIGTTPNSSQVRLLLHSVCHQICTIYGRDSTKVRKVCMYVVGLSAQSLPLSKLHCADKRVAGIVRGQVNLQNKLEGK